MIKLRAQLLIIKIALDTIFVLEKEISSFIDIHYNLVTTYFKLLLFITVFFK